MNRPRFVARRRFLSGVTATAVGFAARGVSRAQTDAGARLTIAYADAGRPIASDFVGLSYESAILAAGDYFTPENRSVLGLIRLLGADGVIRIGGNTSERTVWRADDKPVAAGSFAITPASIDQLAGALRILGWKLVYGLNLARGTPEEASEEAAYVARAVGSNLLAFQIGNEPDGFGRWTAVRPRTFHEAVCARVPDTGFAGPDIAAETAWVVAFAEERPAGLVLLTRHYYALGPAGAPDVTLTKLLRSGGQIVPVLETLTRYGRAYRLP
jgi:hypothetical protein